MTQADYDELLAKQGGGCRDLREEAGKISLHVDHDHETGEIRGTALRRVQQRARPVPRRSTQLLRRAITYVTGDLPPLVDELEWGRIVRDRARGARRGVWVGAFG